MKTAVALAVRAFERPLTEQEIADVAASFQAAVGDCLVDRVQTAMLRFRSETGLAGGAFVVAGGVAANQALRARLAACAATHRFAFAVPPLPLCTDNAAMIAWAGIERFRVGLIDDLSAPARARWPLDELSAGAGLPLAGAKGPRA